MIKKTNTQESTVTDLSYLKKVSNGDDNFIREMIEVYLRETPEAIINLEKNYKNKDWKTFRAITHKMKPSFSFFGLKELSELADRMEDYAEKEIHLDQLPDMISKVKYICTQAMTELKEIKQFD